MTTHIEPKRGVPVMRAIETSVARNEAGKPLLFRISDGTVDRYNSTVNPNGWKFENFIRNPVVLFNHNMWEPPIGKSGVPYVEGDAVFAEVTFDADEFSQRIEQKVRAGTLNAASVQWDPIKWSRNEKRGDWAIDYEEQELLEWSVVTIGGNANALAEARRLQIPEEVIRRHFAPVLEEALAKHGVQFKAQIDEALRSLAGGKAFSIPSPAASQSMSVNAIPGKTKRDGEGAGTEQPPFKEGDKAKVNGTEYTVKACKLGYYVEVDANGQSAYVPAEMCEPVDGGTSEGQGDEMERAMRAMHARLAAK